MINFCFESNGLIFAFSSRTLSNSYSRSAITLEDDDVQEQKSEKYFSVIFDWIKHYQNNLIYILVSTFYTVQQPCLENNFTLIIGSISHQIDRQPPIKGGTLSWESKSLSHCIWGTLSSLEYYKWPFPRSVGRLTKITKKILTSIKNVTPMYPLFDFFLHLIRDRVLNV